MQSCQTTLTTSYSVPKWSFASACWLHTHAQSTPSFTPHISYYSPSINLTGNHKHATKNADGRVDGNHSTIYTSTDILAHPSVQLTRGGLILIGLLSGGDYHAGLSRCGMGTAHGLAKCGFGDELLEATQSLTRAELPEFLARWREGLRNELRTNSRGHLGSKKPSLAKVIPDSFPDIDVLLLYTNPITSATDAGARRTHTPPRWDREPDLAKIGHLCELHFEWGLKDIIIKRFRTVLWPSIVLRALRRSALEKDTEAVAQPPSMPESHQDVLGTPSKLLARHFSSMALRTDDEDEDNDSSLRDLIVKIHNSRMHAYTDGILEYRLEVAPAQLVRLASAGIQGLRKPADTTYDVLPSESEDSDEGDDEGARSGGNGKKKRRGNGPPPEPDSHLRVWMPACMVRYVLPDVVEQYETALEAKRAKKSRPKAPRNTARAPPVAKRKGKSAMSSKKAVEAPPVPADEEYFDLNVSSSGESDGQTSPLPSRNHLRPLPAPLPAALPKKSNAAVVYGVNDVFADDVMPPEDGIHQHFSRIEERPQHVPDIISDDEDNDDSPGLLKMPKQHLVSPSKVLQSLDLDHHAGINGNSCSKAPPATPPTPSSSLPHVLRPFPIAFEEEESSESDREPPGRSPTSIGDDYVQHLWHAAPTATPPPSSPPQARLQWRALPVARGEEEESSDDPDAVPAELPVLLHPPTRGQSGSSAADYTHTNVPLPSPRASPSSPKKRPSRQQPSPLSPSKARRRSPQRLTQPLRRSAQATASATDDDGNGDDNDGFPDDRRWQRPAETSIISISSGSDGEGGDVGDVGGLGNLLAPVAPLLIARSRIAEQKRSVTATAAAAYYRKAGVEPEIIDLT
jgi:hypothetical protein